LLPEAGPGGKLDTDLEGRDDEADEAAGSAAAIATQQAEAAELAQRSVGDQDMKTKIAFLMMSLVRCQAILRFGVSYLHIFGSLMLARKVQNQFSLRHM
jgi:hypothetical protein